MNICYSSYSLTTPSEISCVKIQIVDSCNVNSHLDISCVCLDILHNLSDLYIFIFLKS